MILPDQAVWLIPLAFYLMDNCLLLNADEFLLSEDASLQWHPRLISVPFTWRSKALYVLNPFTPFTCVVRAQWSGIGEKSSPDARIRSLRVLSNAAFSVRTLSVLSFVNLFVAAPIITAVLDLTHALVFVFVSHIVLSATTPFLFRRKGSPLRKIACLMEFIVCPGYLPNICRRYSLSLISGRRTWTSVVFKVATQEDADEFIRNVNIAITEQLGNILEESGP